LFELKLQIEFNKRIKGSSEYISDIFVNKLPDIRSELPTISNKTSEILVTKYKKIVAIINDNIESNELLTIDSGSKKTSDALHVCDEQIEILALSICEQLTQNGTLSRVSHNKTPSAISRFWKKLTKHHRVIKV
jgi:hypothetical protein